MKKKKIAIACQGGGSQTAFTAGVLESIFENKVDDNYEIVGISGTSGGALNAALAWYGLLLKNKDKKVDISLLINNFWEELKANTPQEILLDYFNSEHIRATGKGHLPSVSDSPSSYLSKFLTSFMSSIIPRKNFTDFKGLIESHIDFDLAQKINEENSTTLLAGAANVLTGQIKVFNSREEKIITESILASAAIPSVFPAVEIEGQYYWDGLFSANPPISQFLKPGSIGKERMPDEIWIILIDPLSYNHVPESPYDILERRTQMTSNVSLLHDLEKLAIFSKLFRDGDLNENFLKKYGFHDDINVKFRIVKISQEIQEKLDYASKLSRNPDLIDSLIMEGKLRGQELVDSLNTEGYTPEQVMKTIFDKKVLYFNT